MQKFLGTGVALVTPFNADKSVDFEALEKLVNFQIDNGVNYLVVLGTTGEPATLTSYEQSKVIDKIIAVNNGQLPLVLGVGGNNTSAVVETLKTKDLSGFDAILSVSPYYNKPTQEGIYQHFKAISKASPLPVILYNVPGRTAKNMEPETVIRLARDFDNIIGVKEASGDMVQSMRLIQNKPKDFMVISGDDMIALPMTLGGGAGVISVIGQALPSDFSEMIKLGLLGKCNDAFRLQYKIMDSIDLIFEEGNPAGIKSMLNKLEICGVEVRLPLVKATKDLSERIGDFIEEY
ncbi:4-hydroxy-tetrahydrodipicolinate synthase [Urechidicola croceus]|uniref:4-hydroxy-tetrahydrodipicolinate synthase n=1 Tax=Urechidicola croceus TaxID=1850246 RepID=A0A1D8P3M2_9FLAO|nr:4-hydroxy-tetrahydrodipicolinate synthase [Urechidicola croceus]AOW19188.1 4-hydroxy-tetrahydrodipicolinate synthase [Urechidicola croceus]